MNEPLAKLIAWYLDLNEREKQLSPHTIKAYCRFVKHIGR